VGSGGGAGAGHPQVHAEVPDHLSWAQGAAYFLNYSTAWFTLHRAGFRDGEATLVNGAAGGVGTATLDLLQGRARPSIALVSTVEKAAVARQAGADHVVLASSEWRHEVLDLVAGRGVDVVADIVGGEGFVEALRCLDVGGRLMVVGFAAGIPTAAANLLLLRDLSVIGVSLEPWEQRFPGKVAECVVALEVLVREKRVDPVIGVVLAFDRAAEALGIIDRREAFGKIVVEL
jgi:NADPH2:quinone reductase